MSTSIDNLKNVSKEDSEIVDSILRDLNKKETDSEVIDNREIMMEKQKLLEESQAQSCITRTNEECY